MIDTNPNPHADLPAQFAARAFFTADLIDKAVSEVARHPRFYSAETLYKLAHGRDRAEAAGHAAAAGDYFTVHAIAAHEIAAALASVGDAACVFYATEALLFGCLARDTAALWWRRPPAMPDLAPRVVGYLESAIAEARQADRALLLRTPPPTGCWWSSKWYTHDQPRRAAWDPPESWDHLERGLWEREALEKLRDLEARLSLSGILCLCG